MKQIMRFHVAFLIQKLMLCAQGNLICSLSELCQFSITASNSSHGVIGVHSYSLHNTSLPQLL